MKIAWFAPFPIKGSGGIRSIFQHAGLLAKQGHPTTLFVEPPPANLPPLNDAGVSKLCRRLYGDQPVEVRVGWDVADEFDVLFATAWWTPGLIRSKKLRGKGFYFVQDYEAWFNPVNEYYLWAEHSYHLGFTPITLGRWLSHKIGIEHGIPAWHYDFCADLSTYKPDPAATRSDSLLFYFQPDKPRRCVSLGIRALELVKKARPQTKIVLYGSDMPFHVPFEHENHRIVSIQQCVQLYRTSRLGLTLSASNPSFVPFEMMACGLPVVELDRPNNHFDLPAGIVDLAPVTPEGLAGRLLDLLDDKPLLRQRSEAGIAFMQNRDSSVEQAQFIDAFRRGLAGDVPPIGQTLAIDLPETTFA